MQWLMLLYLGVLGSLAAWVQVKVSALAEAPGRTSPQYRAFRDLYVLVFATAMAGDWLQGPYIYCLYEHYGYSVEHIGRFFIAGFGSSMVFGTIAGVLTDKYGRRLACLMYVVSYSLSCVTKHSPKPEVLLLGRLLGGVSTSLLFSSFEAWVVAEHTHRQFPDDLLGEVFSRASFVGSGLMAIVSGLVGNVLVEDLGLGPVAPFDTAIVAMMLAGLIIYRWPENYGNRGGKESMMTSFNAALGAIWADPRIALLGAMQALFEATMYTFVFLWTPALSPAGEKVPHGMVFACFMTACMVGSAGATLLLRQSRPQHYLVWVYAVSMASMVIPYLCNLRPGAHHKGSTPPAASPGDAMPWQGHLQLLSFCVFEGCLGVFWPSMMTLRAQLLPGNMRSTIINIFRIPLNLFVCLALYKVSEYPLSVMFQGCIAALGACVVCQLHLNRLMKHHDAKGLPVSPLVEMAEHER